MFDLRGAVWRGDGLRAGVAFPLMPWQNADPNITDLHVHHSAIVFTQKDSTGTTRLSYVSRAVFELGQTATQIEIGDVGQNFVLFGVPGDKRFYRVERGVLPNEAKFFKDVTDTGTTVTFPTTPTDHGSVEAMYVFRNVGYASTQNYPLLKSEFGNPANLAHVDSIFDFGYSEQLALCDGFEPYALIGPGAYWVNWGSKSYARFVGHFPSAAPAGGLTTYQLLLQKFGAAKNYSFFFTGAGNGVFLENRDVVQTQDVLGYISILARRVGGGVSFRYYVNAHFPFWCVLLHPQPIVWESNSYVAADFLQPISAYDTSSRGAVLVVGNLDGILTVLPLPAIVTGWPYVFNGLIFLPFGPRIWLLDTTRDGAHEELFTGGSLDTDLIPATFAFRPQFRLFGLRIRRVALEGKGLTQAVARLKLSLRPLSRWLSDVDVTMEPPSAVYTGRVVSDGLVVFEVGRQYQGEILTFEVEGARWYIYDIVLEVEPVTAHADVRYLQPYSA
jgi:hypothetical protein